MPGPTPEEAFPHQDRDAAASLPPRRREPAAAATSNKESATVKSTTAAVKTNHSLLWWALTATILLLALAAPALGQTTRPAADEGPALRAAPADEGGAAAHADVAIPPAWWIAPIGAVLALIFAGVFYGQVKRANPGDASMQEIAGHVSRGAMAYLKRQYKVVAIFFIVASAILWLMGWVFHVQHRIVFAAFLTGGFFSGLCGFLGMKTATLASNRTAQGAKEGLNRGLQVAFRAGAVMGLVVVGFGLLDITMWFLALNHLTEMSLVEITVVMLTFGMGASAQALFARVGGGIYTKAADVGADLVGKVEAGIPEDDPRNPATVADNVGDNVGDVAGMGADLYESYCGSILATAALGVAAAMSMFGEAGGPAQAIKLLSAPMVLAGVGIILSIIGIYMVRTKEGASMKQLMGALNTGVFGSSLFILVAAGGVCWWLLGDIPGVNWWGIWLAIIIGMGAGIVIGKATEYYTSYDFSPTRGVSGSAETGPATVIIAGIAEGMKSTWTALATVIVAILMAFAFAGGFENMLLGLYGVGIAAVGMLATLGITLATDAYGPIADNAGGNAEMTHQEPEVRERTDALDSLGNTTAAVGKGFAIGSAALTALALLAAYVEEVRVGQNRQAMADIVRMEPAAAEDPDATVGDLYYLGHEKFAMKVRPGTGEGAYALFMAMTEMPRIKVGKVPFDQNAFPAEGQLGPLGPTDDDNLRTLELWVGEGESRRMRNVKLVSARKASLNQYMGYYNVTLMNPKVLCGIFSGVLLVFLFSSMTMKAVGRAAQDMVQEVRRQFRDIKGIMDGSGTPDYARCVDISTVGAQKEMVVPSLLALVVPVLVGLVLDVGGVLGLLAGGLTCGFAMAIFMANAGGAWDNAKKYIETGEYGGKGSDNHKATVVGDTVGDPFKDTSGPSLNILIKLMSMVSVVFAGLIVKYAPVIGSLLGME
jgi:inorganic pyrophosphatase/K(+)-stimulated pyrophosphate-energized sodium pump